MSTVTSTFRGKAVIEHSDTPVIYNVTMALANTEYSQAVNPETKQFLVRNRESGTIKLSFSAGTSGTSYITLSPGTVLTQDGLNFSGTIYFQSTKAAQVLEILEWT